MKWTHFVLFVCNCRDALKRESSIVIVGVKKSKSQSNGFSGKRKTSFEEIETEGTPELTGFSHFTGPNGNEKDQKMGTGEVANVDGVAYSVPRGINVRRE